MFLSSAVGSEISSATVDSGFVISIGFSSGSPTISFDEPNSIVTESSFNAGTAAVANTEEDRELSSLVLSAAAASWV